MTISAQDVNKLRQMTGAGMMDCKKALTEAEGDFEAAIDILRKKGQKVSAARAERTASEGAVFTKTNEDGTEGVMVALNCETDFVAKNEEFQSLGQKVLELAASTSPAGIEELKTSEIEGRTLADLLTDLMGKIGEKIEIGAYEKVESDTVIPYIHAGAKLGVMVALKGANGSDVGEIGKDIAMQIAAMNPVAVDKDGVDSSLAERELEIGKEQARAEGKPEEIVEKIAMGKLNKFYKENTLLNQAFVKDSSKTVAQMLKDVSENLTVTEFKRVAIG